MIQTFSNLLKDPENEVKQAAISNISESLQYLSAVKIVECIVKPLEETYNDAGPQFKAGTAEALCNISQIVGKDTTNKRILPILLDLIKDDHCEVKLQVVSNLTKIAKVLENSMITGSLMTTLTSLMKDS